MPNNVKITDFRTHGGVVDTNDQVYTGAVKFDIHRNVFMVEDSGCWSVITEPPGGTDWDEITFEEVMWVRKKMGQEAELDALCAKYPVLEEARKEFEIIRRMVSEE